MGNSSSALYEAPILGVPAINIGDRQFKRINSRVIKNFNINNITQKKVNNFLKNYKPIKKKYFGYGDSDKKFLKIMLKKNIWNVSKQKFYSDVN